VIAYSGHEGSYPTAEAYHGVYGDNVTRTAGEQAGYQLLSMVVSFSIAVISGLICGGLVRCIPGPTGNELFDDKANFEVPGQEIPFYFDERGEINREIFSSPSLRGGNAFTTAVTELSAHGGNRLGQLQLGQRQSMEPVSSSQRSMSATTPLISNELLSLKMDLILQNLGLPVGQHVGGGSKQTTTKEGKGVGDVALSAIATSVAAASLKAPLSDAV
jgi:hypothetical protein